MEKNVTLKLSNTNSKKLIDSFMDSLFINCLNLESNEITEISPGAFKKLPNLFLLNLANNSLPTTNLISFDSHPKLRTLIVDQNLIDKKNSTLRIKSKFSNLQHFYSRQNGIATLSLDIGEKLPNLTHLYLDDNLIKEINIFPPKLTHLWLSNNYFKKFNATQLKMIKFLQLEGNQIKIICNSYCHEFSLSLAMVKNLQTLILSHNEINDIEPDSFDDTINLLNLDLSHNKLQIIRKGCFNFLKNLQNLSLNNNFLQKLPNFSTLQNLRQLNISENKIEKIEMNEFKNFAYLKQLSLSGNLLKTIEMNSFENLMALENLDLSMNKLQHLPINWLTGVENLESLDLRGNCFQNFASLSLDYMESLKLIFLQNNPLLFMNTKIMANFPKSVTIYLKNDNNVNCFFNNTKSHELSGKIPSVLKI